MLGAQRGGLAIADFNRDGILDLAAADGVRLVSVLLGNGDGTFQTNSMVAVGNTPTSLAVGDFNGDGVADLAVDNSGDATVSILLGTGKATFTYASTKTVGEPYSYSGGSSFLLTGDFNGDGVSDFAAINILRYASVAVLLTESSRISIANATNVILPGSGVHHVYAQYAGDAEHAGSASTTWSVQGSAAKASATR